MSEDVDSVVYRAESLLALGRTDQADELVRGALAHQPDEPALLLQLTRILEAQRRWPEVVSCAEAVLAVRPGLVEAQVLLAWSAYRLDRWDLMDEHLAAALARQPQNPSALMCLALGGLRDRSPAGRERVREHYRLALEHSGGAAWYVVQAAEIEVWLGRSATARTLVDDALERFPTDEDLLVMKANLSATPSEQSLGIVKGLLAASPTDTRLRALFDTLVARQRRRLLAMLWLSPALVGLGVMLLDGGWLALWVALVLVAGVLVWCVRTAALQGLPPAVQAELASTAPWRRVTRSCSRLSAWVGAIGGTVLAGGAVTGAWLAVVAVLLWVATRLASLVHERSQARRADAETAAAGAGTGRGAALEPGRHLRDLAAGRRDQAPVTAVLLVPFVVLALVPMTAPVDEAGRATLGIATAVVALLAYAEAWATTVPAPAGRPRSTLGPGRALLGTVLLTVLPVGLMGWLLVSSVRTLLAATVAWAGAGT